MCRDMGHGIYRDWGLGLFELTIQKTIFLRMVGLLSEIVGLS